MGLEMEEQYRGREHEKVRMRVWHLWKEKGKRGRLARKSFRMQRSQWEICVPESRAAGNYISLEWASLRKPTTNWSLTRRSLQEIVSCKTGGLPTGQHLRPSVNSVPSRRFVLLCLSIWMPHFALANLPAPVSPEMELDLPGLLATPAAGSSSSTSI